MPGYQGVGEGSATRYRASALHLLAVTLLVIGLAVSVPPSCVCVPSDHFGALLHPIFAHVHPSALNARSGDTSYSLASHEAAIGDPAPSVSPPITNTAAREIVSGMLLPLLLSAMLIEMARRRPLAEPLPEERAVSPPTPPPRLVPALA